MPLRCPHCRSAVEPLRDAQGALLCPACGNTGTVAAAANEPPPPAIPARPPEPQPAPGPPPSPAGPTLAPGAVASLVFGILAFVLWFLGIVFAPLALVFGYKARRLIAESAGRLAGAGMAAAGRVLGWVWVALVPVMVVMAAVVFVLVSNLGAADSAVIAEDTVTIPPDGYYLQGFVMNLAEANVTYSVKELGGQAVSAGIYDVIDADMPSLDHVTEANGQAVAYGPDLQETALVRRGATALLILCEQPQECRVEFSIVVRAPGSLLALTPSCEGPAIPPAEQKAVRLRDWQPASMPAGTYVHLESDVGDFVGAGKTSTYTASDSVIEVKVINDYLVVSVEGDESWDAQFVMPIDCPIVAKGFFDDLLRAPSHNPAKGGFSFSGEGRGCGSMTGGFAVDHVRLTPDGRLDAVTIRFEQHCDGASEALLGKIVWTAS